MKEGMSYSPEPKEGEIIEAQAREISQALVPVLTTKDLQVRIEEETEQRRLITEFITNHMKEGVDYGTIKFTKKDGSQVESKPSLFKPGSEKFVSLFHFRPTFERDDETWEMSGKTSGLFCYKCELVAGNGAIVGEGRGSADVREKQGWTVNNAIKIAEKRAQIDAVLRTGGLSDFFTQDIEDMVQEPEQRRSQAPVNRPQPQQPRSENNQEPHYAPLSGLITPNQARAIYSSIKRFGVSEEEFKTRFSIEHIGKMTKQQAHDVIDQLFKMKEWGN
jgi:hypothetical protein